MILIISTALSVPLGEEDPSQVERISYFGHMNDGGLMRPTDTIWMFVRRLFIKTEGSDFTSPRRTTEISTSPTTTNTAFLNESTSEASASISTKTATTPASKKETRPTISPVNVPYSDYNYPSLN